VLVVPRIDVPRGPWTPPPRPADTQTVIVVRGLLARHSQLVDRVATQLLGAGDVVDVWGEPDELLPCEVRWTAHEPVILGVLDRRFAGAAQRWPVLAARVQQRLSERADRMSSHAAALALTTVEMRILAILWQLAERFGHVTNDGVVVRVALTHRLLGELVGAQRPSVTLALARLVADGAVSRTPEGFVLARDSRERLRPR
jgi:CRP/FNR family transcriptional regulator, cyclic AMP receptor protein